MSDLASIQEQVKTLTPDEVKKLMALLAQEQEPDADDAASSASKELVVTNDKAVWTTAEQNNFPDSSFAYISPGGKKDASGKTEPRSLRHLPYKDGSGTVDLAHVRNALARVNQVQGMPASEQAAVTAKLQRLLGETNTSGKDILERIKALLPSSKVRVNDKVFSVARDTNGDLRFFIRYSNGFIDRESEHFSSKSHENFVEWADRTKGYPELWIWHTPGTRLGVSDWLDYSDGMACGSGIIDNDQESVAIALAQKDVGASHGFVEFTRHTVNGVIGKHISYELSVLPPEYASNNYNLVRSKEVTFTPAKRKFLLETYSEDAVNALEKGNEELFKQLKEANVSFKSADEQADATGDVLLEQMASLTDAVRGLAEIVKTQEKSISDFDGRVSAVQKSIDEQVAEALKPRGSDVTKIERPSQSDETLKGDTNIEDLTNRQKDMDWFGNMVDGLVSAGGK